MSLILCGPREGDHFRFRCICCDFESDNVEDFAVSLCWECAFGGCDHHPAVPPGVGESE